MNYYLHLSYGTLKTLSYIFSYTIIFSLIPDIILSKINTPSTVQAILVGIFELSNGINKISSLNIDLNYKICITSFILSFSSFMILMQIYSFVSKAKVKFKEIIKYKLLQGVLSCIITYIITAYIFLPVTTVNVNLDHMLKIQALSPSAFYILSLIATLCITIIIFRKKRQD